MLERDYIKESEGAARSRVEQKHEGNATPFIDGMQIFLREVRLSDVDGNYCRWMNDPEITQYLESRFAPAPREYLREFVTTMQKGRDNLFLAIIAKDTGEHIGNIKLGPINWIHRSGDIGLLIGEKRYWGKGIATETIKLVVNYGFNALNLQKLTASCYSGNFGSVRAFEKVGFVHEGVRKSQFYSNGQYVDQILLGLMRKCA
jgi:RimJ/RimL family protein N-acetyltransferase